MNHRSAMNNAIALAGIVALIGCASPGPIGDACEFESALRMGTDLGNEEVLMYSRAVWFPHQYSYQGDWITTKPFVQGVFVLTQKRILMLVWSKGSRSVR